MRYKVLKHKTEPNTFGRPGEVRITESDLPYLLPLKFTKDFWTIGEFIKQDMEKNWDLVEVELVFVNG